MRASTRSTSPPRPPSPATSPPVAESRPGGGSDRPLGGVVVGRLVVRLLELLAPAVRQPVAEDGAAGVVGLVLEGTSQQAVAAELDRLTVEAEALDGREVRTGQRDVRPGQREAALVVLVEPARAPL